MIAIVKISVSCSFCLSAFFFTNVLIALVVLLVHYHTITYVNDHVCVLYFSCSVCLQAL